MMQDVLVYLSGPITAANGYLVEENTASALKVYIALLQAGVPSFCPHLSAAFPSAFSDISYDVWLDYDFAVIRRCTHVLMLPRWETSKGAGIERSHAKRLGLPVFESIEQLQEA